MKPSHLLISLVGLIMGLSMVLAGVFLLAALYVPFITQVLRSIVLNHLEGLSLFGFLLLLSGIIFLTLLSWLNRRHYLLFKMGEISVEEGVVAECALRRLQTFFPDQRICCDVVLNLRGDIEIIANLPPLQKGVEKKTLRAIEKDLSHLLQKQFHYTRPFLFNVNYY
jgi:hypothetical protein